MIITSNFQTPIGFLEIRHDEQMLYQAIFTTLPGKKIVNALSPTIQNALNNYFTNPTQTFELPLSAEGSIYQKKVWEALLDIPAGQTKTYGEIAVLLKSSPRAIGQACKRNPLMLFIPCHRVVAKTSLGGYMGANGFLNYKMALLEHERIKARSLTIL